MVATNDIHDPMRPEVPDAPPALELARVLVRRIKDGVWSINDVEGVLLDQFESGAIAGMKAQYEHDQQQAASQR